LTTPVVTNAGTLALSATGANIVTASTNGVERLRIDSSGNVGIGTSSPAFTSGRGLQILHSDVAATLRLQHTGASANASEIRASTSGNLEIFQNNAFSMVFGTSATERLRIDSAGNVGIGTSAPSVAAGLGFVLNGGSGQSRIALKNNATTDDNARGLQFAMSSTGEAIIDQRENQALRFTTNTEERIRITNTGNVGIGTSAPTERLTVNAGDIIITGNSRNQKLILERRDSPNNYEWALSAGSSGGNQFLSFIDNKTGVGQERLRIDSAGNVGIGTSSPSSALDVIGNIEVSGGIYLGGTAAANLLDDYEEGTWTPALSNVDAGPTEGASASYLGTYVKIGNIVHCRFNIDLDDATNNVTVDDRFRIASGDLPFVPAGPTFTAVGNFIVYKSIGSGDNAFGALIISSTLGGILNCYVTHTDGTAKYSDKIRGEFTYEIS
jgi:uncharacterized protein YaiE (UPF0345 family)